MRIKSLLVAVISFLFLNVSIAQEVEKVEKKESKVEVVEIQTSAVCKMCKKILEHDISFAKGVKSVKLDDKTKVLTVIYKKGKTDKEKIKKAITKSGYDADDMIADPKAYKALPECCKKFNDPH